MPKEPDVPWEEDELVLVLNMHHVHGTKPPAAQLTALSRELRDHLGRRDGEMPLAKVRSTTGVSDKLNAFEALWRKTSEVRGSSQLVTKVWTEFGRDCKRVWEAAKRIRELRAASAIN